MFNYLNLYNSMKKTFNNNLDRLDNLIILFVLITLYVIRINMLKIKVVISKSFSNYIFLKKSYFTNSSYRE